MVKIEKFKMQNDKTEDLTPIIYPFWKQNYHLDILESELFEDFCDFNWLLIGGW